MTKETLLEAGRLSSEIKSLQEHLEKIIKMKQLGRPIIILASGNEITTKIEMEYGEVVDIIDNLILKADARLESAKKRFEEL